MKITARRVLLSNGFVSNCTIVVEDGVVKEVLPAKSGDVDCDTAVPGLIDQHLHGGFGADVMRQSPEKLLEWLHFLLRNGETQVLAGIYTSSRNDMRRALENVRQVMRMQQAGEGGAKVAGVHLEGPFISRHAPGAMLTAHILPPNLAKWNLLTDGYEDIIRMVTIAPEEEGALELIGYLRSQGIMVSAGHTTASAEEGRKAFAAGVDCVTHFFNASTPIHHRRPGILTEALLDKRVFTECICDFVHVHPSAVRLIYHCKGAERMIVVSDAVFTTGLKDGTYSAEDEVSVVEGGISRTPEGALMGGSLTQLQEVRNLISIGIPAEDAFYMASQTPADYLRISGGRIVPGARAEILCLDDALQPLCVVNGKECVRGGN